MTGGATSGGRRAICLLVVLLMTAVADARGQGTPRPQGEALYIEYGCYQCHGYEGQGGLLSGPRIAPDPLPLKAFMEILRRPYGVMPAYSEHVVTDETLTAIHGYLRTIESPAIESVKPD